MNRDIRIKYRINGALFRRTFDNAAAAQARIAVLRDNGVIVKSEGGAMIGTAAAPTTEELIKQRNQLEGIYGKPIHRVECECILCLVRLELKRRGESQ